MRLRSGIYYAPTGMTPRDRAIVRCRLEMDLLMYLAYPDSIRNANDARASASINGSNKQRRQKKKEGHLSYSAEATTKRA